MHRTAVALIAIATSFGTASAAEPTGLYDCNLGTKFALFADGTAKHFDGANGVWELNANTGAIRIDWAFNAQAIITIKDNGSYSGVGILADKKRVPISGNRIAAFSPHRTAVGTFEWGDGRAVTLMVRKVKDPASATHIILRNGEASGTWSEKDDVYTLVWSDGAIDRLKLSREGNLLEGVGRMKTDTYGVTGLRRK